MFSTNAFARDIYIDDVPTSTFLGSFATVPTTPGLTTEKLEAFSLLPPFDGTGGLIVADWANIKRLDGMGAVVQTYDADGRDSWLSMDLAPDGSTFWAADTYTNGLFQFDIESGAVVTGPIHVVSETTLFGVTVIGAGAEPANNPPVFQGQTPCDTVLTARVGHPISYRVLVSDGDGDEITLSAHGVPAGASHEPGLPVSGPGSVSTTLGWTPHDRDVGTHVVTYTASDHDTRELCKVTIIVERDPSATRAK